MTAPQNRPPPLPANQPRHRLSLGFPSVKEIDFELLDSRLTEYGLIDTRAVFPGPQPTMGPGEAARAAQFLRRAMMLSSSLQQAGNIPCFEMGEILTVSPKPQPESGWQAEIDVVAIEGLPKRVPREAMSAALKSLFALNTKDSKETTFSVESLFTALEQRVISPMWSANPTGKSTIAVLLGAYRNNVPFCYVGPGIYQLGWGANAIWVDRSSTDSDSMIGSVASENKAAATLILRKAGLPTTRHVLVHTEAEARDAMKHLTWPVVVKPADRDRGEGVTIDINDQLQLAAGLRAAQKFSKNILVEEQISGVCHRILVSNEQLLFAVRRDPKSVEGDGEHTLFELIAQANNKLTKQPPWKGSIPLPWDQLAVELALAQGFNAESVITRGEKVKLRKIESTQWGGTSVDVTKTIHPENIALAVRAAALFRLSVCGIDLMTPDIEKPWHETNAKILEVNVAPIFTAMQRPDIQDLYISATLKNVGQIPVELLDDSSEKSIEKARQIQSKRVRKGERCFLLQRGQVFAPDGNHYRLNCDSEESTLRALLMDKSVESLVVVPNSIPHQIKLISD